MTARIRTTSKTNEGSPDETAPSVMETGLPARDDRSPGPDTPDSQLRHEMIACAAYCRAERRGFAGGADAQLQDWLEAEAEIDRMLAERSTKP